MLPFHGGTIGDPVFRESLWLASDIHPVNPTAAIETAVVCDFPAAERAAAVEKHRGLHHSNTVRS
jgi:hypothetical protein